jgi:DNA ligase (NAD+)
MDIEGLGEQRVQLLVDRGLLGDVADLYSFDAGTFEGLEGFAALSISNLLGAIDESRGRPLSRVLIGLGIRHLGQVGSVALARALGDIDAIVEADESSLAAVDGVGPIIAASVVRWFASEINLSVVDRLRTAGVNLAEPGGGPAEGGPDVAQTLTGQSVVVSGTLEGFTREEAEEAVIARGGKSPGSVSKKTLALVVGASPGASKVTRAEQLGIPVVDEAGFVSLLETGRVPT